MTDPVRQELFRTLAELSQAQPDVRLGQLITNLSCVARGLSNEAVRDVEDKELLAAARRQLEQWRAKHAAGV